MSDFAIILRMVRSNAEDYVLRNVASVTIPPQELLVIISFEAMSQDPGERYKERGV